MNRKPNFCVIKNLYQGKVTPNVLVSIMLKEFKRKKSVESRRLSFITVSLLGA